jgi:hypothetical protein
MKKMTMQKEIDEDALTRIHRRWDSKNITKENVLIRGDLVLPNNYTEDIQAAVMFQMMFYSPVLYGSRIGYIKNQNAKLPPSQFLQTKIKEFATAAKKFSVELCENVGFNCFWDLDGDFWIVENDKCILSGDYEEGFRFDETTRDVSQATSIWGRFATCTLPLRLQVP